MKHQNLTRENWRKIAGIEEDAKKIQKLPNGKRILGGYGAVYYGGWSKESEAGIAPPPEKDPEKEKEEKPGEPPMPEPPKECVPADSDLQKGDEVQAICGKDCETGEQIIVRLVGEPAPPEGWESACTPPDKEDYDARVKWTVEGYLSIQKGGKPWTKIDYPIQTIATAWEVERIILEWAETAWEMSDKRVSLTDYKRYLNDIIKHKINVVKEELKRNGRVYDWCSHAPNSGSANPGVYYFQYDAVLRVSVYAKFCYLNAGGEKLPDKDGWPAEHPPELVYDPVSGCFKNPCPDVMPLPEKYKSCSKCVTICDEKGNKVTICSTNDGFKVTQTDDKGNKKETDLDKKGKPDRTFKLCTLQPDGSYDCKLMRQ